MEKFKALHSSAADSNTNGRFRRRRPLATRQFLAIFLAIASWRISLCNKKNKVEAHTFGRLSEPSWSVTNCWRKRPFTRHAAEECLRIQRGGANRFVNDDDNQRHDVYERRHTQLQEGGKSLRKHSPVVYQYFGRSRSRGGQSQGDDSPVNFILLGPNVDHWKTVGQTLAARGFNVMACERMVENKKANYEDAPDLVLEILGA